MPLVKNRSSVLSKRKPVACVTHNVIYGIQFSGTDEYMKHFADLEETVEPVHNKHIQESKN